MTQRRSRGGPLHSAKRRPEPAASSRAYGLAAVDIHRDFFLTANPSDPGNVGRVDLARAPLPRRLRAGMDLVFHVGGGFRSHVLAEQLADKMQ